jgi:hypothetical protein
MSFLDLCTQKIFLKPWSLGSLSLTQSTPSPLEAVASLLLPTLPDCTSLVLSSLPFPSEFWSTRSRALTALSKDAVALLSFSLHTPTVSDSGGDFERLYLHPLVCGVLGVTCIDATCTQERFSDGVFKFFDSSTTLMKKWGVPTFIQPPSHLIVFDFSEKISTESLFTSSLFGKDARRVHIIRASSFRDDIKLLRQGVRYAISSLEADIILQLLEDFRATAVAGGDAQIVASKSQQQDDPDAPSSSSSSSPFVGRLSCGVDVSLTAGLSQVSVVMGTAKRRLHARLLRRRGEAALLIGSHIDAIDNFEKAIKAAKASTDILGLALIEEGHAAALYRKEIALNPSKLRVGFLPEVAAAMREAVQQAEIASVSSDIQSAFLGVGSLHVVMRLRLANLLLIMAAHSSPSLLPKEVSRWIILSGEMCENNKSALSSASLDFQVNQVYNEEEEGGGGGGDAATKVKHTNKLIQYRELRESASTSMMNLNGGGGGGTQSTSSSSAMLYPATSLPKTTPSSTSLLATQDSHSVAPSGLSIFSEISECLGKASILCATSVRPLPQQIRCILLTCRLASQMGLRRKADVLLLRAARLLRSLQSGLPQDMDAAFRDEDEKGSTTNKPPRGGCVYAAAVEMQPLSSLPLVNSIQEEIFRSSSSSSSAADVYSLGQIDWPWPWIHSSCMIATQSLPLPIRSCAPSILSASLTLAALRGMTTTEKLHAAELSSTTTTTLTSTTTSIPLVGLRGGCLQTQSLRRAAIADFFQSGEFTLVLSLLGEDIFEDSGEIDPKHVEPHDQVIRLPTSSRMLRSLPTYSNMDLEKVHVNVSDALISSKTHYESFSLTNDEQGQVHSSLSTSLATAILADSRSTLHSSLFHRNSCVGAAGSLHNPVGVLLSSLLIGFRVDGQMSMSSARASLLILSSLNETSKALVHHSLYGSCCSTSKDLSLIPSFDRIHQLSSKVDKSRPTPSPPPSPSISQSLYVSSSCTRSYFKPLLRLKAKMKELCTSKLGCTEEGSDLDLSHVSSRTLTSSDGVVVFRGGGGGGGEKTASNPSSSSMMMIKNSSSFSFGMGSVDEGGGGGNNAEDQGSPGVYATPRLISGQGFEVWKCRDLITSLIDYISSSAGIMKHEEEILLNDSKVLPAPSSSSGTLASSPEKEDFKTRRRRLSNSNLNSSSSTSSSTNPPPFVTAELPLIHGTSWLQIS